MTHYIELREAAAGDAASPIHEAFAPLTEKAVRRDGTIGIKIIGPGWGSSGYYDRSVLERDIPRIFPPGTKMFWNHDTATEEAERPEGDLSRLAAVTVSTPIWQENGAKGPGMYADARPFSGYAETIDEIGEHIGVSIRGMGRHRTGEAEGRQGRIIDELVAGKSVDFVTVPGAGGAVLSVFESAPGAETLPPTIQSFLAEAGRVLSKANEKKLRTALEQLTAVLSVLDDVSNEMNDAPLDGMGEAEAGNAADANNPTEDDMELEEAMDQLAEAQAALDAKEAALAKLREQLVLREARDFVMGKLAEADLPDITKTRLVRELVSNPPVVDGAVDEAALGERVETAVTEAQAEIAAIAGSDGRVTGNGEGRSGSEQPTIESARTRLNESLAAMGYGGNDDN